MAYYECGGYSKADLDKAYNNGYIAGTSASKAITVTGQGYSGWNGGKEIENLCRVSINGSQVLSTSSKGESKTVTVYV